MLASKHFNITEDHPLEILDSSGMSNPVLIVKPAGASDEQKVIMRFFESSAASFEIEIKVFDYTSKNGMAPAVIESDRKTYRIE